MGERNKTEMIIRYCAIGFALAGVVIMLIYLMLFHALEKPFSLNILGSFHMEMWYLYLVDILPLLAIPLGALLGNWRFSQMEALSSRVRIETEKNSEIRRFTHSLIAGDLNTSFAFPDTDQTLSDSLILAVCSLSTIVVVLVITFPLLTFYRHCLIFSIDTMFSLRSIGFTSEL